jgi:ribose-phosphate pyrophosphokinase
MSKSFHVIAGTSVPKLAEDVMARLNCTGVEASITKFDDGEVNIRLLSEVRGKDVLIIQSMCGAVNDVIMETVLVADAAYRAGAKTICLVSPYLAYMRQDRKDKKGAPISAQVIAKILSNSRIDHVVAMDLHAKQNQGFFDILMDELYDGDIFMTYISDNFDLENTVMTAPDAGAIKNVRRYAELLALPYVFVEKERLAHNKVEARNLYGDVDGKHAIIIDDICSSGGTLIEAAQLLKSKGATRVSAFITHGLFTNAAVERIESSEFLDALYCTDSINNAALLKGARTIQVLSTADHIATSLEQMYVHGQLNSNFA